MALFGLNPSSIRRLAAWAIGPCVPAWIVFAVLYFAGRMSVWEVLGSGAGVLVLMAVLVLPKLTDFDRLVRYAESLFADPNTPAPTIRTSATAQRLMTALNALRKLWTDRREESESLARSRQDILDGLPDPLILLDRRRRIVGSNAAALSLLEREPSNGRPAQLLNGLDLAGVIRDPKVLEAADQALALKKRQEAFLSFSAPVERTFRALIVPLAMKSQDGPAMILALQEQTERLKMDRMRADFVANASHELRTPLASVVGFIETLRGPARDDGEARDRFLDIMLKQGNRMTRLIDDLLSLSRIELREHTRPTDSIDLAQVLRSTTDLLEVQARHNKSAIKLSSNPNLPRVVGDASELGQVFYNLMANGVKYGGSRGPVEISASRVDVRPPSMPGQGPCVRVSVRDYGDGIAKEHLPRLTERFYRVDSARSRELGGTGLGLAIVKHITNRHRGALVIESEVGAGSTFSVYLPIAASSAGGV
jgi:two-component system, OmpR family, phosphate regulon sensor histidine kinase PhoR